MGLRIGKGKLGNAESKSSAPCTAVAVTSELRHVLTGFD